MVLLLFSLPFSLYFYALLLNVMMCSSCAFFRKKKLHLLKCHKTRRNIWFCMKNQVDDNQFARDACSRLTKATHTATIWIWLEHHFSLFLATVPPNYYRSLVDSSFSITRNLNKAYILHSSLLLFCYCTLRNDNQELVIYASMVVQKLCSNAPAWLYWN